MIYIFVVLVPVIVFIINRYLVWHHERWWDAYMDARYGQTIDGRRWLVFPANGQKPRNMALLYNSRMVYVREAK